MSYMDLLTGSTRTNAPVVKCGTFNNVQDARNIAAQMQREDTDSYDFRAMDRLIRDRNSVCG